MPRFFAIILLLLIPSALYAQTGGGVSGQVADSETGEGMEFVTVTAVNEKGKAAGATISGKAGRFALHLSRKGRYTLHFSFVGYSTASKAIDYQGDALDAGVTKMAAGLDIDQVSVVAKPLVRREGDRIVYDVGADPDAGRMKMMEIMKKVPGLEMNAATGNLRFGDAPVARILFDGQEDGMIHSGRQYPMSFIKADVMGQIELILPGSAEYGNDSPIINIKLSRPLPFGIAGQLKPQANTRGVYDGEVDLVTKTRLTGIGVNYRISHAGPPKLKSITERYNHSGDDDHYLRLNESESWNISNNHNLGINLFRPALDQKMRLALTVSTTLRESNAYTNATTTTGDREGAVTGESVSASRTRSLSPMRFNGGASLIHYLGRHSRSNYSIRYAYSDNVVNTTQAISSSSSGSPDSARRSDGHSGVRQHAANFMFVYRPADRKSSKMAYLNAGYVNRFYENATDYYFFDPITESYETDRGAFNGMHYRQQVANVRMSYSDRLIDRKLGIRVGLILEHVNSEGYYLHPERAKIDYREFNVLPEVRLDFRHKLTGVGIHYNTRVRRPDVKALSPFVDSSNPDNIITGNPRLKGEYTHNLGARWSRDLKIKWLPSISISYNLDFTNNAITMLTAVDDDNRAVTSYANLGRTISHKLALSISLLPVTDIATIFLSPTYFRNIYELGGGQRNALHGLEGAVSATLDLNRLPSLKALPSLEIMYNISSAFMSAQSRENTYYSMLDISISKYLQKIKLGGSIGISDLLHGNKFLREVIGSDTFTQYSRRQRVGRTFKISIYWRFGKFRESDKGEAVRADVYDLGD